MLIGGVVVAAVIGGGALAVAHPWAPGSSAPTSLVSARVPALASSAAETPIASPTAPAPAPSPSAGAAEAFTASLSASAKRALLLTSDDLAQVDGVRRADDPVHGFTLEAYAAKYTRRIDPAPCNVAKGLMLLGGLASAANAPQRTEEAIQRSDDLRVAGNSQAGSQQIRQFASESDAIDFMQGQRSWFDRCSTATYTWSSANTVDFEGAVFQDSTPDLLLTSATDSGSVSGLESEFDGWTRVGSVVYAAYLLGDSETDRPALETAGSAVIDAARAKLLAASGASDSLSP